MAGKQIGIKRTFTDRVVELFNPKAGLDRYQHRLAIAALGSSGYLTPGSSRKSLRGWSFLGENPISETVDKGEDIREGVRDLFKNSPVSGALLRRMAYKVVGPGLTLQARPDYEALGLPKEQASTWTKQVEREFRMWSKTCDATQTDSLNRLAFLALLSWMRDGDVFAGFPMVKRKGQVYQTRVMLIDGAQVGNNLSMMREGWLGGVKCDKYGAPEAYYIRDWNPQLNDWALTGKEIPAFGSKTGRRNIVHLVNKEWIGQRRGVSILAPVIEPLRQITQLSQAAVTKAIIQAFITVFITHNQAEAMESPVPVSDQVEPDEPQSYEMGSGTVYDLDEGDDVKVVQSTSQPDFDPVFKAIVMQIGANVGVAFEVLMMHFTASYSASRAALMESWTTFLTLRTWLVDLFLQEAYEAFLWEAVASGRIIAPGFFTDPAIRAAWCASRWTGRGPGQIDPLKEVNAAEKRLKNHLTTHEDEHTAIHGGDWDSSMDRLAAEEETLARLGLKTGDGESSQGSDSSAANKTLEDLQDE